MEYLTLLGKIENLLLSFRAQGINYLSIKYNSNYDSNKIYIHSDENISNKNNFISTINNTNVNRNKKSISEEIPALKNNLSKHNNFNLQLSKKGLLDKNKLLYNLYQNYKSCLNCDLSKTRNKFVFGHGEPDSKIMFIGEGPGEKEDKTGEPFVGRAGKLLTKMINSIGIERQDIYITNIVKCRPPQNRNPFEIEISKCSPILKQQIEIINPKLIVTLGNFPAKTLIPDIQGITKIHGKVFQYGNWKILPTFHPSYLLRNRSSMSLAWQDFKIIPELAF